MHTSNFAGPYEMKYRPYIKSFALMMEAAITSETSTDACLAARGNITEDIHLCSRRSENQKSQPV
jgi:hypothetical protein